MAVQISALPTPPTRQDPTNFNDRADAFLSALPTFQTEANTLSVEVNNRADNVQASDLAVMAATNITKWVSGTTYAEGAVVWSPINGLGYRRITASGSGTTDPSLDTTNYKQVNGTGDVSTSGNQTISGVKVFNDNLGLGVTPSAWGPASMQKALQISSVTSVAGDASTARLINNSYIDGSSIDRYITSQHASAYAQNAGRHIWFTAPSGTAGNPISFTQAMTLDASGNLFVGTVNSNLTNGGVFLAPGVNSEVGIGHVSGAISGSTFCNFRYANASIGSIVQSGTTAVAYNTSSDYRLKHNIAPMQGALARVQQLKPVTYKWNADNSDGEGFIAHELAAVCPQAVTGEKDAVDADGQPVYQGIDTSFLVATLAAAIQEQQAIITELRSRIEALEAK